MSGVSWHVSFRFAEVASDDCHSPAVIIPSRAGVGSGFVDLAFNQKSIVVRLCLPLFNSVKIGVIGMGYVGLPLAVSFSKFFQLLDMTLTPVVSWSCLRATIKLVKLTHHP